ncbi:unnamed protein product [Fraxinus pennsylvanica]|uniref:Uncharacterized protein n=1 Tax=Fraxinus pennsylvanica TaxID=56036 RepID=A0AAD2EAP6_9LAMI|nr:unnamed protein product [Fraxinus pennsylvanica]
MFYSIHSATADASQAPDFLKAQDYSDAFLNQLQFLKLRCISGTSLEMAFIKLLLEKTSEVKEMVILAEAKDIADKGFGILKELNTFERAGASPNAKVIYED